MDRYPKMASADSRGRVLLGSSFKDRDVALDILSDHDDDIQVGFVRHGTQDGEKFGLAPSGIYNLMVDNKIALDWGLGGRLSPSLHNDRDDNETSAERDVNAFYRFRRNGVLVFAYYPSVFVGEDRPQVVKDANPYPEPTQFARIGYIPPGTPIKAKKYRVDPTSSAENEMHTLNTMQMTNVVEVSEREDDALPLFDTDNHLALGTASRWPSMAETVREVYFERYNV